MTSKSSTIFRRYPLKRVRTNQENPNGSISALSNGRIYKKICRPSSQEDSITLENEKSSDERALELFHKEYFSQIRPYFKHRSIAQQLVEHLWNHMIESSKIAFVKKTLKEQKFSEISPSNYNDENLCQLDKSTNEKDFLPNRYTRGFLHDFLNYLKHFITPRFVDMISASKITPPLRRSSRIRRAPIKCVCSSCSTNGNNEEHSFSDDSNENHLFAHLINHYHQLDDQYVEQVNPMKVNETEINGMEIHDQSTSILPDRAMNFNEECLPSMDVNEKVPLIGLNSCPSGRTYVILTELDEPFFGPYPIEFTITI